MDKKSIIFIIVLTAAFFVINNVLFPTREVHRSSQPPEPAPQKMVQSTPAAQEGELYVIENSYQQLVISSLGGSIAEINLPLQTKENPHSVVKEIGIDRTLKKDYPKSDIFPLRPYQTAEGSALPGKVGGYYPLLRRGIPAEYFGLAVLTDDPGAGKTLYRLKRLEKNLIELEGETDNRRVTKIFSFPEDPHAAPYCFDVVVRVDGDARGLMLTTGVPEVEMVSGSSAPILKYRITRGQKPSIEKVDLPKTSTTVASIQPDWICNSNGFFGVILDPRGDIASGFTVSTVPGAVAPTRLSTIDAQYDLYPPEKYPGYDMRLPFRPTSQATHVRVFAGPFDTAILKKVDQTYTDPQTGYNPDYVACQSFHGWFAFISEPFAKFLFFLMQIFHFVTRSWGVSIILLTLALRLMMYPLNAWSIRSTIKMQKIAPKISALQEKYKKDPKKMQMEMMQFYRENKINPLGGCFPLLIQMPFLIGMFDLLKSSFELRGVSFIPGWITNLTAPDVVFSWNVPIWFFGTSLHLLPILLGATMYWQQKISSNAPKDTKFLTDQQKQQKMMGNIMVVVFTVLFYHFPSGLNIYWLSSILLGILQQWWMTKSKPS
jgi:YidC/Oxa1 family membrane protein insertase